MVDEFVAVKLAKIERKPGAPRPTEPVDFRALLGDAAPIGAVDEPQPPGRRPMRALARLFRRDHRRRA